MTSDTELGVCAAELAAHHRVALRAHRVKLLWVFSEWLDGLLPLVGLVELQRAHCERVLCTSPPLQPVIDAMRRRFSAMHTSFHSA